MVGDTADMLTRLKMVLPSRWFADVTPVLDALLTGFAVAWSSLFSLLTYVRAQTRIGTATDIFLDIASKDYFGNDLPRRVGEVDALYRNRIKQNLTAPRATRASLIDALVNLTGRQPVIFEPLNATDAGGYNSVTLGYGVSGGYGCTTLPFQFFLKVYRPLPTAVSNAGGYNEGPGGYDVAPMLYVDTTTYAGMVTDAEIFATVTAVLPICGVAWTSISN